MISFALMLVAPFSLFFYLLLLYRFMASTIFVGSLCRSSLYGVSYEIVSRLLHLKLMLLMLCFPNANLFNLMIMNFVSFYLINDLENSYFSSVSNPYFGFSPIHFHELKIILLLSILTFLSGNRL